MIKYILTIFVVIILISLDSVLAFAYTQQDFDCNIDGIIDVCDLIRAKKISALQESEHRFNSTFLTALKKFLLGIPWEKKDGGTYYGEWDIVLPEI